MKQTAVEWLINELGYKDLVESKYPTLTRILEQAKEMEKEQIYKALCRGHSDCGVFTMTSECEQYYNEIFKSE